MKKQISLNENDLKSNYILFAFIPILAGIIFLLFIWFGNDTLAKNDFIKYFAFGWLFTGVTGLILSILYVPYCYKIEVDENKVYITKSEAIILTKIEKTIQVDKKSIKNISNSFLGLRFFWTGYNLFYLNLKDETEYGFKIAFLAQSKSVTL